MSSDTLVIKFEHPDFRTLYFVEKGHLNKLLRTGGYQPIPNTLWEAAMLTGAKVTLGALSLSRTLLPDTEHVTFPSNFNWTYPKAKHVQGVQPNITKAQPVQGVQYEPLERAAFEKRVLAALDHEFQRFFDGTGPDPVA